MLRPNWLSKFIPCYGSWKRRSSSPADRKLVRKTEKLKSICSVIEAQFDIRKVQEELATFKLIFLTIL